MSGSLRLFEEITFNKNIKLIMQNVYQENRFGNLCMNILLLKCGFTGPNAEMICLSNVSYITYLRRHILLNWTSGNFLNYHDNRGLSFLFCEVKVRRSIYLEKNPTNFKIVRNLVTNSSKFYKQYSHTCRNCKMMIFMHRYSKIFSLAGHFCFRKIKSYIIWATKFWQV